MPTTINTTITVTYKVFDASVILNGIPSYLFTDYGTQFVSKCFGVLGTHVGKTHDNDCISHTDYRTDRTLYITTMAFLRHYVATYERDFDLFAQPLTYPYNTQLYWSTNTTSSSHVLTRQRPGSATFCHPSSLATDAYYATEPQALCTHLLLDNKALQTRVTKHLESAQE